MSKQGFIKVYRQIQDHWIYDEKRKFSKYEAWLDMIMLANHKDNKFVLGNELIELKKGQFVTSELKLMDRWDWGKAKLRNFLELLEKDEMIIKISDRKKTTITICNYGVYHDYETDSRPPADHEQTDSRPPADTNKNVKNDNNDKNEKKVSKKEYADFVKMTEEEYLKLVEQFGETSAKDRIEKLSLYKGSTGKKYKSDYLTILNWSRKETHQRTGVSTLAKNDDARKFKEDNNIPF